MDQIHEVWHSPVVVTLLSIHCNFSHFDAAAVTVFVIVIRVTTGIVCLSSHTARTEWHLQTLFGSRAICIAWQFKYFALIYALLNDNTCVVIKMFILREFFFFRFAYNFAATPKRRALLRCEYSAIYILSFSLFISPNSSTATTAIHAGTHLSWKLSKIKYLHPTQIMINTLFRFLQYLRKCVKNDIKNNVMQIVRKLSMEMYILYTRGNNFKNNIRHVVL